MTKAWDRKTTVRYVYDALGRRVRAWGGANGSTKFTYQGDDVLLDESDGTVTKYLNGRGIDNKLRQTTGSTTRYFLSDHLGSTNGLADSTGTVTASQSYDSFGNPTNAAFPTRYQFTGREFDSVTRLQYSRARWYDPAIGRFISEDPIGFEAGDLNLYGYVQNNPISHADPSGLIDPIVYQDPKIYNFHFAARREGQNLFFGDGGLFTQQTFSEFLSANERSKRKCKSTWTQRFTNNFYETNAALPGLGAPALIPGLGVGTLTSKATASAMNSMTVMEWASTGFRGARIGAATLSAAETGLTVAASTAVNTVLVTGAYEGGVGIGSAINATFGFTDYCPCEQ